MAWQEMFNKFKSPVEGIPNTNALDILFICQLLPLNLLFMVTITFQDIGNIKNKSLIRNDSSIKIIRTKTLNGIVGIISVVRTLI